MSQCRICGDEHRVSFHAGSRMYLCEYCAKDTPKKVSFDMFVKAYFPEENMEKDYASRRIALEFYSDYKCSCDTLKEYIKNTTGEES